MQKTAYTCPKCVDDKSTFKKGKTKNGKQRYLCKNCGVTFLTNYTYNACKQDTDENIKLMLKEEVSIS